MPRLAGASVVTLACCVTVLLGTITVITGCERGKVGASDAGRTDSDARAAGVAEASGAELVPSGRLDAILADSGDGFTRAVEPRRFEFPRDHGPHPEYRHEWWYFTGNLDAASGERFGFELTIFRFALAPQPDESSNDTAVGSDADSSRWRTRQIYMAHFAITDVERRQFHFSERFARQALGLAGAQAAPFCVWLEDWSVAGSESAGCSVTDVGVSSDDVLSERPEEGAAWKLRASQGSYDLTLDLRALLPPVLNGERGLSRKSSAPGAASYYYSIPRIEAQGRLVRDGRTFEVRGLAWLDREWGSGALDQDQQGWDWFALQMSDGSALMFYALRHRDGSRDLHSAGTWVDPDGGTRQLTSEDVKLEVLDRWTSPRGGSYPSRWRLSVPALNLDVDIRPVLEDQELATLTRYWEGAVDVTGSREGLQVAGRGYVELVGYADAPDSGLD